jgi:hypothetical protein
MKDVSQGQTDVGDDAFLVVHFFFRPVVSCSVAPVFAQPSKVGTILLNILSQNASRSNCIEDV